MPHLAARTLPPKPALFPQSALEFFSIKYLEYVTKVTSWRWDVLVDVRYFRLSNTYALGSSKKNLCRNIESNYFFNSICAIQQQFLYFLLVFNHHSYSMFSYSATSMKHGLKTLFIFSVTVFKSVFSPFSVQNLMTFSWSLLRIAIHHPTQTICLNKLSNFGKTSV